MKPLADFQDFGPDLETELGNMPSEPQAPAWGKVEALPDLLPQVPTMPPELVPNEFRDFTADVSDRLQVPLEIPAVAVVAALSSVVGRTIGIYPKRFDSWLVVGNLWGMVVAPSGMLKTPSVEEAFKPLGFLASRARKQFEDDEAVHKADCEIAEARISATRGEISKAAKDKSESRLTLLRDELATLTRSAEGGRPVERRYRVNDSTTEKILELLVENPRGLLVFRDELAGWLRSLDKHGREMDRALYLEAWNGFGSFTSDRIGRGSTHVEQLCLSVFGGIQPTKLSAYVDDALKGAANDDGLLQRFQLAVYPEIPRAWILVDRPPNKSARDRVTRIFEILDGIPLDAPALHFDPEAQDLFNAWLTALQGRILGGSVGSSSLESHLSKFRKLMPALSLLFHLANWADEQIQASPGEISPVSLEAAQLAAAWSDYLELHSQKIYSGVINPELQAAHALAEKIQQGKVKHECSPRDIYRPQWSGLKDRSQVYEALQILTDFGWVKITTRQSAEGRPTDIVELHPDLRKAEL